MPEAEACSLPDAAVTHPLAREVLFNPSDWSIWPAVAVLRWLLRTRRDSGRSLVYRSHPSLTFAASEIKDVALSERGVELTLSAPGLAAPGTILPASDVARIAADLRAPGGGALAFWLDGPGDLFMQAVEASRARYSDAFAFATGARAESLRLVTDLAGDTAPLSAGADGRLAAVPGREAEGALGLSAQFVSATPSAAGLSAVLRAYTGLPNRVREFAGATVRVLRPARLGHPLMRILGRYQELPSAGVDVIVDGGSRPEGARLAARRVLRRGVYDLCAAYIGSPSIRARVFVELEPDVIEPAKLGGAELGGLAVLGRPAWRLRLPLSHA
ncbi:MAG: type VI secretion system baseplate subunit TssG [Gammaproteobacteria bacterium]|nr:type VI secretion system baseplate subunit TssG [Gammaproteobacteria bacterium]MDE0478046.1 type VI secretion system baseplate subunit TssG [Gammaproteobacteria bacterium]MDE0507492.1 type VI secretion system baseplate subunit TssG [Gammaproteobacteria bacterium]MXX06735.1 type VI secretion system baseplate subunit TssG [Gammaproteobacteria bacterium]MYE30422.1 type VI secretion system baseplate subunit TssG [Gammaproteobacteria bacterium]